MEGGSNLTKGNLGGQNVDKLVTDYLTGITTHTMQYLRRQLGDVIVNTTPFHFVLTVPAIWSDQAMQRTRDAFERAMASHAKVFIQMISEPEAAATCVLKTMHRNELNAEDCFIVVDAGGGTVVGDLDPQFVVPGAVALADASLPLPMSLVGTLTVSFRTS